MKSQIYINDISEDQGVLDVSEFDIKIVEKKFLKTHSKLLLMSAEMNSYKTIKFNTMKFNHERL